MLKNSIIVLLTLVSTLGVVAQNQLFKGKNLLMPSNLVVNYIVRLDTCYKMINGQCIDYSTKAFLANNQEIDLFGMIVDSALSGNVNCFQADSWLTYQIMENRKKLSVHEIKNKLNITDFHSFDKNQIIGLNFIEDWQVSNDPISFKKNVISYMPVRCYYNDDDSCYENPLYQTPFTIIDTLVKKHQIKKSIKRMLLINEISSEYFFYLDYSLPFDIDELTKTYKKSKQSVGDYQLSKETSEYISVSGITNFLKVIIEKVLNGELSAFDYYKNTLLTIREIVNELGIEELIVQDSVINVSNLNESTRPIDYEEIRSIIFIEKWYIDPLTFRMQKKVIGIAPVRHYYSQDDEFEENLKRKILFKVYFDEREKF